MYFRDIPKAVLRSCAFGDFEQVGNFVAGTLLIKKLGEEKTDWGSDSLHFFKTEC